MSRLVRKGDVVRSLFREGMPCDCSTQLSSAEMKLRHEIPENKEERRNIPENKEGTL